MEYRLNTTEGEAAPGPARPSFRLAAEALRRLGHGPPSASCWRRGSPNQRAARVTR